MSSLVKDATENNLVVKPAVELSSLSGKEVKAFLETIDTVIFDCDGVLWHTNEPFEDAQALVTLLRSMGKRIIFLTNNSTNTRDDLLAKFIRLGFDAKKEEILGTAYLIALHLKQLNFNRKAYVIGSPSIAEELQNVGIECLPVGPDLFPTPTLTWVHNDIVDHLGLDPDVGAVIISFDPHFSYMKAMKAAAYLDRKGPSGEDCLFLAADLDELLTFPQGKKLSLPGGAAMLAAVTSCTSRTPTIIAKPEVFPFQLMQKEYALDPRRVLMIGDRGATDIRFGRNCGLWTLLMLSGFNNATDLHSWEQSKSPEESLYVPHYYAKNVSEFYHLLKS